MDGLTPEGSAVRVCRGLYLGGHRAGSDAAFIRATGITHVVVFAAELGPGRVPGVDYACFPVHDRPQYDLSRDAPAALAYVRRAHLTGGVVLLHCYAGISRSASLALLFLMVYCRLSLKAAFRLLVARRPFVRPNPGFMAYLRSYERSLAEARAPPS